MAKVTLEDAINILKKTSSVWELSAHTQDLLSGLQDAADRIRALETKFSSSHPITPNK